MKRLIQVIKCLSNNHKYHLIQIYSPSMRKIGCQQCNKIWAMNDDVQVLVKWDDDFERLHKEIRDLPHYNRV